VIQEFLSSWTLFRDSYLAGWLIAAVLPVLGVLVVARDQIFVGAAVSQASLLGIACALRVVAALGIGASAASASDDVVVAAASGAFAILAALVTAGGGPRRADSHESITGFVFLASASAAVLLMAHSPHGMDEINRLLASTLIGATAGDVLLLLALAIVTAVVVLRCSSPLLLLVMDAEMAEAVGLHVRRWNVAIAIWLGVVVGLSNRVAGAIFTFGCLVLPALAARSLCREVRTMFVVAPVLGVASAVVAFVLAHAMDFPPGQTTAFLQCLVLLAAWTVRLLRRAARAG
jgi:zinc transport system permease protein